MNNNWWPAGQQCCFVTLERATYGKVSMASIVSSPDPPSIWPRRIRAADTVDTPIPARQWLTTKGHWRVNIIHIHWTFYKVDSKVARFPLLFLEKCLNCSWHTFKRWWIHLYISMRLILSHQCLNKKMPRGD